MKKLVGGEVGTRDIKINVEKRYVDVKHLWKKDKDSDRYELQFRYQFDCEMKEIYRLAALWINKDMQNRMRQAGYTPSQLEKQEKEPISVREFYEPKKRVPKSKTEAALDAMKKLSEEEREALLKMLAE